MPEVTQLRSSREGFILRYPEPGADALRPPEPRADLALSEGVCRKFPGQCVHIVDAQ